MPNEEVYCAEQIKIPPELPDILKKYAKHIIRTQPSDILSVSAEYFGRLAHQKSQVGKRLTQNQLEAFYLKIFRKDKKEVTKKELEEGCVQAEVTSAQMNEVISLGNWGGEKIPWMQFWFLLIAASAGSLNATIELACKILGDDGMVETAPIAELVKFLSSRDPTANPSKTEQIVSLLGKTRLCSIASITNVLSMDMAQ